MDLPVIQYAKEICEQELRKALAAGKEGGIEIYYQPLVHVSTGKVIGAEALTRWVHPLLGDISPRIFVPLAESNGLVTDLDRYVLTVACQQARRWQDTYGPIRIATNISPHSLQHADFVAVILNVLQETRLPPECLEIELTENIAIRQEHTLSILARLKGLGIKIAIDDFGTGYSSLNYLRVFPVDTLKIDQVFVRDVESSQQVVPITSAIIRLAHELNLQIVAEGVETEEQKNYLLRKDCHVMQGFLFSKPLPADQFERFLQASVHSRSRIGRC